MMNNANMNIEEYLQSDVNILIFGFCAAILATLVSGVILYLGNRICDKKVATTVVEEDDKPPYLPRPQAGQIWYKKAFDEAVDYIPWIDVENLESWRLLEIRYDYIKAKNLNTDEIYYFSINDLYLEYMQDDFGDIPRVEGTTEVAEPLDEEAAAENIARLNEEEGFMIVEEKEEIPELPAENIIKIDGKDFILTPVKK